MFFDKVKRIRIENGLSQREFAKRIGVSPTMVVSYEKGRIIPGYDILANICREFEVSLDWLCDISENARRPQMSAGDIAREIIKLFEVCDNVHISDTLDGIHIDITGLRDDIKKFLNIYEKTRSLVMDEAVDIDVFNVWLRRSLNILDDIPIK